MSEGKGSGAYPHYPGKERAAHLAGKRIASMPLSHGSIRAERGDTIYGAPLLPGEGAIRGAPFFLYTSGK
jgi:hypothetical protein